MKTMNRAEFRKALTAGNYLITDRDDGLATYVVSDKAGHLWGMKLLCNEDDHDFAEDVANEAIHGMAEDQHPRLMAKIGDRYFWK